MDNVGRMWKQWGKRNSLLPEVEGKKRRLEGCSGGQLHFVVKERQLKGLRWE